MKDPNRIFDEIATSLTIYFIYGGNDNFKTYRNAFDANLELKPFDEFPDYMKDSDCDNFTQLAYNHWRKFRNDFEREKERSKQILMDCCNLKSSVIKSNSEFTNAIPVTKLDSPVPIGVPLVCSCGQYISVDQVEYFNRTNEFGEEYGVASTKCDHCLKDHETSQWGHFKDQAEAVEYLRECVAAVKMPKQKFEKGVFIQLAGRLHRSGNLANKFNN